MSVKLIEVRDLSVYYQGFKAISQVSFDVEKGDYIGIVGPNGSGKTTLIKAILGLVPFEGSIKFGGLSLREFTLKHHIGYLPQRLSFIDSKFPALAKEIIVSGVYCCKSFPKRISGQDYRLAEEIIDILGIRSISDKPIGVLSGGQQQRVLLARALVHHPEILILDEPTVALDPKIREVFYSTINKINKEKSVTVILVSHDIASIGNYTSKLLYLDRKLIFYGTFEEFCKSTEMGDYFGNSQHFICHRHQ
ncbi:MAG: metal ABC transporter ATP-binding protein [Candidatus Omnitrophica bacterium]|nr:metal ABC transporter ATP-binding protein [Candidatus Omnitrophota bacterium]MCM8826947.1 metal ABC transporter ATP-binding protein [Candidatus Omnitrophota bacterium]